MKLWYLSEVFADDADYLERGIKNAIGINGVYERHNFDNGTTQFEIYCNETEKRLINSSVYQIIGRCMIRYRDYSAWALLHRAM